MKFHCDQCGFEEIPENFHAVYHIDENQQNVYIVCPKCGDHTFFQHFHIPLQEGDNMSMSHLLAAPGHYSKEEAYEFADQKIRELELKSPIDILKEWAEEE